MQLYYAEFAKMLLEREDPFDKKRETNARQRTEETIQKDNLREFSLLSYLQRLFPNPIRELGHVAVLKGLPLI